MRPTRPALPSLRRCLALVLGSLGLCYALTFLYLLTNRESVLFERSPASYAADDCRFIAGRHGNRIACVYFASPGARRTLLYSHGSATDLGGVAAILAEHRDLGFNVLAYDYPGTGLSEGRLSENACNEAIEDLFGWLRTRGVPAQDILVYGRSIGTGPSVYLASRETVGGLILASPFTSAFGHRLWMHLFPFDWFRNGDRIHLVNTPILVLHGTDDSTISVDNGRALAAKGNVEFVPIAGRGHADLHEATAYRETLRRWTELLPERADPAAAE